MLMLWVVLGAGPSTLASSAVGSPSARPNSLQKQPKPLPPGWHSTVDPASKITYYWHEKTRETTWKRPAPVATPAPPQAMVPPPSPPPDLVSVDVDRAIKETRQTLRQIRDAPRMPELRIPKMRVPELRMPELRSIVNAPKDSLREAVRKLKEDTSRDPEKASPLLLGIYLGGVFLMAATFL